MEKINKLLNKKLKKYISNIETSIDYDNCSCILMFVDIKINGLNCGYIIFDIEETHIKLYVTNLRGINSKKALRILFAVDECLEVLNND